MSSRFSDLGKKFENLIDVLGEYENLIDQANTIIQIKGKNLAGANAENPSWQLYYSQKATELRTVVQIFEREVARVRSSLFRSYKQKSSIELTSQEINKYIDGEEAYLSMQQLLLEVKEIHEKYQSIVDAFTSRGYALNNLTKIYTSGLEHIEI